MNLKKIPKEKFPEIAKDVVDLDLNFKKVADKWDITEPVVIWIFQKYGKDYVKSSVVEQRIEELATDYFDKQKRFLQKAYDVKTKALERIELLLDKETRLDNISKALEIIDKITLLSKDDDGEEKGKDQPILKL